VNVWTGGGQATVLVRGLVKEYRNPQGEPFRAVDALSFEARPGSIFGLLGPNGAGKTTALRMLSTLIPPTAGDAWVGGFSILASPSEVRRRIGFLTGTTGLYPRLTAREVVRYFAHMYGMDDTVLAQRIDRLFEELAITPFQNKRCGDLSTGMKQKVSIARAIVHDPPVLILDEPTTGLDVLASQHIVEFILRSRDAGKCVLFSTHIMSEAEYLCDRILLVHRGRIVDAGPLTELLARAGAANLTDAFLRHVQGRASGGGQPGTDHPGAGGPPGSPAGRG
jgi:sodium transport system ATP-binding protein